MLAAATDAVAADPAAAIDDAWGNARFEPVEDFLGFGFSCRPTPPEEVASNRLSSFLGNDSVGLDVTVDCVEADRFNADDGVDVDAVVVGVILFLLAVVGVAFVAEGVALGAKKLLRVTLGVDAAD